MEARLVKVTDKGQISIPVSMQRALRIKNGDRLLMVVENDGLLVHKATAERLKASKRADTVAPVKVKRIPSFSGILKGSNITWNKEVDGWNDKE